MGGGTVTGLGTGPDGKRYSFIAEEGEIPFPLDEQEPAIAKLAPEETPPEPEKQE